MKPLLKSWRGLQSSVPAPSALITPAPATLNTEDIYLIEINILLFPITSTFYYIKAVWRLLEVGNMFGLWFFSASYASGNVIICMLCFVCTCTIVCAVCCMWPELVPSPARCVGNAVMLGPDTGQLHNWGAVINHKYPGLGSLSLPRNIAQEYGENNTKAESEGTQPQQNIP